MSDNVYRMLLTRETHLSIGVQSFYWGSITQSSHYKLHCWAFWCGQSLFQGYWVWPIPTLSHIVRILSGLQDPQANKDTPIRHKITSQKPRAKVRPHFGQGKFFLRPKHEHRKWGRIMTMGSTNLTRSSIKSIP